MSLMSGVECASSPRADGASFATARDAGGPGATRAAGDGPASAAGRVEGLRHLAESEAQRLRRLIEAAIGEVFGVASADLSAPSRGKAPVALARQAAMYLAHVSCRLNLTDVGMIFGRDRTTVAHACAVIEDRRDDPVFDRALELMEWIVPTLVGRDLLHAHRDI